MKLFATAGRDRLCPSGHRLDTADLLMSTLAINTLSLALPVMTLQVYDRILPNPGSGTLPVFITGVCIAVILETAMRLGRAYTMGWTGAAYEHRLSCDAMARILRADLAMPARYGIGERMNRLSAIGRLKDFYNGYSTIALFELLFVPLFLALIVYIAGPLAVVPVAVLMAFTLVSLIQGRHLRQELQSRDVIDDRRYNFLIESLEGVHSVKSFGLENNFSRRYEALEEKSTLANYRVMKTSARTFDSGSVFSNLMVAAVIGAGAIFVLQGVISTGALIATILLSGRIMQPVQRALALWAKYQDYTLSRRKVESIFDAPLHPVAPSEGEAPAREGTLSINNVSFRRVESGPWILKDINLHLGRGECISLATENNRSLSSLMDLIAGIYAPTVGEILVDGRNTLQYRPRDLIDRVGYIQSEGIIFRGTIRDNLTCFGQLDYAQVREMSALLHIDRDIAALPAGFDTYLNGNATDTIAPGLKQRISIVRVLASKPRIIIFDNADRALDREGYNLIFNLLGRLKGKATLIISSNDHNLTAQADRFYRIDKGRLSEISPQQGTHKNIHYRELKI